MHSWRLDDVIAPRDLNSTLEIGIILYYILVYFISIFFLFFSFKKSAGCTRSNWPWMKSPWPKPGSTTTHGHLHDHLHDAHLTSRIRCYISVTYR